MVNLKEAYRICRQKAFGHYENFPVASLLLPTGKRDAVAAVYAFAREADDFADEPEYEGRRIALLDDWEARLDLEPDHPVFIALRDTIRQYNLPVRLLKDLLSAFRQDVTRARYADFSEVRDYCRLSADPVGRLVLRIFGCATEENDRLSDCICTALQLTNFWQDLSSDALVRDRIYLPADEMRTFKVKETQLMEGRFDSRMRNLVRYQVERTASLFDAGAGLCDNLPGRLGFEIKLTLAGGRAILDAIRRQDYNTLTKRPKLGMGDWATMLYKAVR